MLSSVTFDFSSGDLAIDLDGSDSATAQVTNDDTVQVSINGTPDDEMPDASDVYSITVTAGDGGHLIDLSGLQPVDFPYLPLFTTITTGAGDDTVTGTGMMDTIDVGDGNDLVDGNDGDDHITGGLGDDTLSGGAGFDSIFGSDDHDELWSGSGAPDGGTSALNGGTGVDLIDGTTDEGAGDDSLPGETGGDSDTEFAFVSIVATNDGAEGAPVTNGTFTVSQTTTATIDTVVTYGISGTAVSDVDYAALASTVTIVAGTASATINVSVLDDSIVDGSKSLTLTLISVSGGPSGVMIDSTSDDASIEIQDDDSTVLSVIGTADAVEGAPGENGEFTLQLTNAVNAPVSVPYTIQANSDPGVVSSVDLLTATSGIATIPEGITSYTLFVSSQDDALVEGDEDIRIVLGTPTISSVEIPDSQITLWSAAPQALIILTDDDTATVSITGMSDGADGLPPVNGAFMVTQSAISTMDTVISYSVTGTATADTDYEALSGTVTIPADTAGSAFMFSVITVPVLSDIGDPDNPEGDETVIITLDSVTSATPGVTIDSTADSDDITIVDSFVKFDLDIDSDNDDGFGYPENDDWEEELEDHPYALGKLLYPSDTHFVPVRLRLQPELDTEVFGPDIRIGLEYSNASGNVFLWDTYKADPDRNPASLSVAAGGNRLFGGGEYSLSQLNYDSDSGALTIWVGATQVYSGHDTYKDIVANGKPTDSLQVSLTIDGATIGSDSIQFMVVKPHSFYPNYQSREELRNAIAAGNVYNIDEYGEGPVDDPRFALNDIPFTDLRDDYGIDTATAGLVGEGPDGLKSAVFRDYVSGKYILAFAGTDFQSAIDWLANIKQGIGWDSSQYANAAQIATALNDSPKIQNKLVITGHSLGGGLASLTSLETGVHADTFNSAGLHPNTYPDEYDTIDVNAYYVDWDILSFLQDKTPESAGVAYEAIGNRVILDGPVDLEMTVVLGLLAAAGWNPVSVGGIGGLYEMGKAHTTQYFYYGLMVGDLVSDGGNVYGEAPD